MRLITNIFVATAIATLSYSAIAQPVNAITFSSTTGTINDSPDGTPTQTDFTFTVLGVEIAPSYTYTLTINGLNHASLFELEAYLIRTSDQATLNLFARTTLNGNILDNTKFVDAGDPFTSAPYTGNFAPENNPFFESPLNKVDNFNGFGAVDPNTTWTLRFYDTDNGNDGNLVQATLDIIPVPFEFEASAGVLTLGAIFGINKWRKNRLQK